MKMEEIFLEVFIGKGNGGICAFYDEVDGTPIL